MACVTIRRRVKISSLVALLLYIGLCKDRHGKNKVREAVGRAWKVLNGEDEMRGEEVEGVPSSPRPSRDEAWVERTVDDVLRFWFNHGSRKMRNLNRKKMPHHLKMLHLHLKRLKRAHQNQRYLR